MRQKLGPADSVGKLVQIDSRLLYGVTGPFAPASFVPGVGRDFEFMAQAALLKPGQISKPVKGISGVYVIQLLSRTPFDSTTFKIQKLTMMQQTMQQMKGRIVNDWLQNLKTTASIEDNRAQFFK